MSKLKFFVLWIWQMPQHLLALVLINVTRAERRLFNTGQGHIKWWYLDKRLNCFTEFISGISLGEYILMPHEDAVTIMHEHGHSVWSMYLGWLYLPVVGIYSAVFCNLWDRLFHKNWNSYDRHYWYYKTRWTEREADKAGNVDRDAVLRIIPRPADSRYPAMPAEVRITTDIPENYAGRSWGPE